jgi:hypothetical protein
MRVTNSVSPRVARANKPSGTGLYLKPRSDISVRFVGADTNYWTRRCSPQPTPVQSLRRGHGARSATDQCPLAPRHRITPRDALGFYHWSRSLPGFLLEVSQTRSGTSGALLAGFPCSRCVANMFHPGFIMLAAHSSSSKDNGQAPLVEPGRLRRRTAERAVSDPCGRDWSVRMQSARWSWNFHTPFGLPKSQLPMQKTHEVIE